MSKITKKDVRKLREHIEEKISALNDRIEDLTGETRGLTDMVILLLELEQK